MNRMTRRLDPKHSGTASALTARGERSYDGTMVEVQSDNGVVRMVFPTDGLSPEQVDDFVTWLRVEGLARRSQLSEEAAWRLSDDIKAGWWEKNKTRFGG